MNTKQIGIFKITEYHINGERDMVILLSLAEEKETKEFKITQETPSVRTQAVVRRSYVGRKFTSHDGEVHPGVTRDQVPSGLARSTRMENCQCNNHKYELVDYWNSTQDTIQNKWNLHHSGDHVHGYDYSGYGMYADKAFDEIEKALLSSSTE